MRGIKVEPSSYHNRFGLPPKVVPWTCNDQFPNWVQLFAASFRKMVSTLCNGSLVDTFQLLRSQPQEDPVEFYDSLPPYMDPMVISQCAYVL